MPVPRRMAAAVFLALGLLMIVPNQPASAEPFEPPSEQADGGVDQDEEEPGVVETLVTGVSSFFFDTRSLFHLVNRTLTGIVTKGYDQVIPQWRQPLNFALLFTVSYSADGLARVPGPQGEVDLAAKIYPYWRVSLSVAFVFFPLILIANIAQAYTSGSSAPVARAEMLSSVVQALLRFAFVASSWWAGNTIIKISWGLAEQLVGVEVGPAGSEIAARLTGLILNATLGSLMRPGTALLFFYLLLFIFFMTILLVTALLLSHYAFIALAAIFIILAPLVIAIGALPFFGWLYGTWMKLVTGLLVLPIANVLILKLAFSILPLSSGGSVVRLAVALGVIGVLITVNFSIAKITFSPAMQAAKMAGKSIVGLGRLVGGLAIAAAGGAGLASAAGGMLGGGGGTGAGIAGEGLSLPASTQAAEPGSPPAQQTSLSPGRLNALRRKAEAGDLSAQEFSREKAAWGAAKDKAGNSLAFRDPLLRGAMGAWMADKSAPVDTGLAEIGGMLRDKHPAVKAAPRGEARSPGPSIPWNRERVSQLVKPANPAHADAMYGWAREAFSSNQGPFYPDIQSKLNHPGFNQHFEGLLTGAAVAHSDVQPLMDGTAQNAWVVSGMGRAEAVEAISRAGEFFGGEVQTFARAIANQHESGERYLGDFSNRSIHNYVRSVITQFQRKR